MLLSPNLRLSREILLQTAVFAAHLAVAIVGMRTGGSSVTEPLVWMPLSVALGAFLIGGLRFVPAVLLASIIGMQWLEGLDNTGRLLAGLTGTIAPAAAAWALKRYAHFSPELDRVRDLGWLLVAAVPLASAGNSLGVTLAFLCCSDVPIAWMTFWASWALATAVGTTILTPTMLLVWGVPHRRLRPVQWVEMTSLVACLTAAFLAAIYLTPGESVLGPLAAIATLPLAIAASLRFDRLGAAASGLVCSIILLVAAVTRDGPFDPQLSTDRQHAVLGLWGFVLALQTMSMLLGVSVAANRRQTGEIATVAARLRHVVDAARLGYWQFDRDLVTTHANARFAAMLGTTEAALVGRSVLDVVAERQRDEARRRLGTATESGGADVEFECMRSDGGAAWLALHLTTLMDGGAIAAVEDLAEQRRDEAERLRLETNILHAQRLESLGVLSGGIAHDFNNIVMGIRGNAGLLRLRDAESDATRDCADRIDAACERAAGLVDTLLAYAGRGPFTSEQLSLTAVLRDSVKVARLAAPRAAHIILEQPAEELLIDADRHHLRQMLLSIITNGVEALDANGGAVRIVATAVREDETGDRSSPVTHITISDDGCGMDQATVTRVFEPFFTSKGLGRGLGMSAAVGIARRLGGSIEIHSRLGAGTAVRVVLPIVNVDVPAAERGTAPPPQPPVQRLLAIVVEPEISVRDLIIAALQIRGFAVTEERSLATALAVTTQRTIGLVVADSGRSVIETLEVVRQSRYEGCTAAIILTIESRDTVVLHPSDSRTLWLARPFGVREFLDVVDESTRATAAASP